MIIPIKYTLSLSCFLFFLINVQAQNTTIDSLKKVLHNHKEKDTTRVNLLNELAFSSFTSDIVKSIEYLEEANTIADLTHFKKGKARSLYIKGITEAIQSNYNQALIYYEQSLNIYKNITFEKGVADCYNAIGLVYKNKGDFRTAITFFEKAIKIYKLVGSKTLSVGLLNLGSVYIDLGEFDKAIMHLKKVQYIAENEKNEQRIAYSLNNLGTIFNIQGNYPLALDYFNKSLAINKKLGDSINYAHNLSNIAKVYKAQKNKEKAVNYYKKSMNIFVRLNNKHNISTVLNGLGVVYQDNGDNNRALKYYLDALKIGKEVGQNNEMEYTLNNIGQIYTTYKEYEKSRYNFYEAQKVSLKNGNKEILCSSYIGLAKINLEEKNYDSALKDLLKAKQISEDFGFLEYQKQVSEILSHIYELTNQYQKALNYHKTFKKINDSIFNKENIQKITQLEYEYKYKQALDSASIRELKLTNKVKVTSQSLLITKRNYLWAIIGVLLVSIILSSIIFYQKLKNAQAKTETVMIEQKLLRSQMTPHFIFNSLSVLQGMILNKEEKKSVEYLSKFSKLLRISLENSRDKTVLLSQELNAIENYLILQNLENSTYDYKLFIDSSIDVSNFKVPPMLIQPFVENAIEHAFSNDMLNKKIDIQLKYVEGKLICTIIDNGVGYLSKLAMKKNDKTSLSTIITSERLKILAKDFKMDAKATIEDRKMYNEQGTIVTLIIPHKILTS